MLDEYTRECLALEVERSITSSDVIGFLDRPIAERGGLTFIHSDNWPEFIAEGRPDASGRP